MGRQFQFIESFLELQGKRISRHMSKQSSGHDPQSLGLSPMSQDAFRGPRGGEHPVTWTTEDSMGLIQAAVDYEHFSKSAALPTTNDPAVAVQKELAFKFAAEVKLMETQLQNLEESFRKSLGNRFSGNMSMPSPNILSEKDVRNSPRPGATPPSEFQCQVEIVQAALKQFLSIYEHGVVDCVAAFGDA